MQAKVSIMHIIDSLNIGGAERMLVDIVNNMDSDKYTMSVCVTRSGIPLAAELKPEIPIKVLSRKWRFDPQGFNELSRFSKQMEVDAYHAHGRSTFSFLLVARKLGIIEKPIIFHDHFGDIGIDKRVPVWFRFIVSNDLNTYIAVSDNLADWFINIGLSIKNIHVVENALDFNRFLCFSAIDIHEKLNIPKEKKICIFIGNIRPAKGLDLLIDAFQKIPTDKRPVCIVIGKHVDLMYTARCQQMIEKLGLSENFTFLGQKNDPISWIKGADFAVMPSRSESGPLVLIEFIACGLPFVAFNVGGVSAKVSQNDPTYFVSPNDTDQFALKVNQILSLSSSDLLTLGQNNYKIANRLFNIKQRIPIFDNIYRKIVEI